jgi:hypothetical protein
VKNCPTGGSELLGRIVMYGFGCPSGAFGSHDGLQIGLPFPPVRVVPTCGFSGAIVAGL